jgi:hypothetical protein
VESIKLSKPQQAIIQLPVRSKIFLEGPAGCGKTTTGVQRLLSLLAAGIPGDSILVLTPQRTLAEPYSQALHQADLPAGGVASVQTIGGLSQRTIDLFWPLVASQAGFAHPEMPPHFLTLESAQYYLARLVKPLLEKGYFEAVTIDRNRLYSQIIDNLNKAAAVGFAHTTIGERLKSAWAGDPGQLNIFDQVQESANLFRDFCLANNLLDFSLQIELFNRHLWPSFVVQQYLKSHFKHLIVDNVEEDIPVAHDLLKQWLSDLDSAMLIYNTDGGFRIFLGADTVTGYELKAGCADSFALTQSFATSPLLISLSTALEDSISKAKSKDIDPGIRDVFSIANYRFLPEMVDGVTVQVDDLIQKQHVPPSEIVVLAPFISDSLRFSLRNALEARGIPVRTHRPSRSLREEPATLCLLTLAKLAHPDWKLYPSRHDLRYAFMQVFPSMDLVRADLLSQILFSPSRPEEGLGSFDRMLPEKQERITYVIGEKYEQLRSWLLNYMAAPAEELDVFLSHLYGEVLSQKGFGFFDDFDTAAVAARLIESIQKFRRSVTLTDEVELQPIGKEYIQMVEEGVIAAQYLQTWHSPKEEAVLIAPAYTFLMADHPADYQFWLDIGSLGWWQRLYQPLTHPYVLSRHWTSGAIWSDIHEVQTNQAALSRLVKGLIYRCRQHIYFCTTSANERGDEERGPLLQAIQMVLRRLAASEVDHV